MVSKKIIVVACLILTLAAGGCTKAAGETLSNDDGLNRFVIIERVDKNHYVVADKKTRYEYFMSRAYSGYYIIGGNVFDDEGKPLKFIGTFPTVAQ